MRLILLTMVFSLGVSATEKEIARFPFDHDSTKYCPENQYYNQVSQTCQLLVLTDEGICDDVPEGEIVLKECTCGCRYFWECQGKNQTLKQCLYQLYFVEERQLCTSITECTGEYHLRRINFEVRLFRPDEDPSSLE